MISLALCAALAFDGTAVKTTWQVLAAKGYKFTFGQYAAEYGKVYETKELPTRQAAFEVSLAAIKAHNEAVPTPSWFMGLSEHSDKTDDEWKALKGLHRGIFHKGFAKRSAAAMASLQSKVEIPASLDWRTSGVVTPVKNQGSCGSCWAFSATETVESAVGMASLLKEGNAGTLPLLAPQQLVDCSPNPDDCGGTGGCEGSIQPLAFDYLLSVGGMDAAADYPYTARDGTCKATSLSPIVGINGYTVLPTNNYTSLINALVTAGPISISVDASWGAYSGGIYTPSSSGIKTDIDHAVQLVGYGTDAGQDYWLVRNSWGTSWGEGGYIRLARYGEGKEPCGTDYYPQDGFGCNGGPSTITVCGTSGMLSGSSFVLGAHMI